MIGAWQVRDRAWQKGVFQSGYLAISSGAGTFANRLSVLRKVDSPSFRSSFSLQVPNHGCVTGAWQNDTAGPGRLSRRPNSNRANLRFATKAHPWIVLKFWKLGYSYMFWPKVWLSDSPHYWYNGINKTHVPLGSKNKWYLYGHLFHSRHFVNSIGPQLA